MKKQICIIILFLICRICESQSLVLNGGFEQYSSCPTDFGQIDSALNWTVPTFFSSSEYYNQCSNWWATQVPNNALGYQPAHSGTAYCGFYLWASFISNVREYVEGSFASSLIANECYHFEMYVNLGNESQYTTDAIGVYFSDTAISGITNFNPLPFIPQINNPNGIVFDTLNWTLVSGDYTAIGGEDYLVIGNFKDDLNTNPILINNGGMTPSIYVFVDDVSLTLCTGIEEQNKNVEINIYPNPFNNKLNIAVKKNELSEIIIFDIVSRKILQQKFTNSVSLNTEQLAKGLYLYEVRDKNGLCKKGKVVKD